MTKRETSYNNGFIAGRQAALDVVNERIKYLVHSAAGHSRKIRLDIGASVVELQNLRNAIEVIPFPT